VSKEPSLLQLCRKGEPSPLNHTRAIPTSSNRHSGMVSYLRRHERWTRRTHGAACLSDSVSLKIPLCSCTMSANTTYPAARDAGRERLIRYPRSSVYADRNCFRLDATDSSLAGDARQQKSTVLLLALVKSKGVSDPVMPLDSTHDLL
jgi:hypothetical protein